MSMKTIGAKFILKSHGDVGTLIKHTRKKLSQIVKFILSIIENKESLKCQSRNAIHREPFI